MCVIVHQPKNKSIDKATAQKLWDRNPDGGGFAFVDDDSRLQVYKTMSFGDFWSEFEQARSQFSKRDFLLHMRIATHGSVSLNNVHPFVVDDHTVMAHNGIIHPVVDRIEKGDDRSDTRFFIDEVLPKLPETWLDDPDMAAMVDGYIGWSKLMFVTTNPKLNFQIYRLGEWKEWEGIPMSNTNGLHKEFKSSGFEFSTGGGYRSPRPMPQRTEKSNIYELPLPRQDIEDVHIDSSQEWSDWLAFKEAEWGNDDPTKLDMIEFEILLDSVKSERATMMLVKPIVVIDQTIGELECSACMEKIDLETAECGCWDLVCQGCWQFLALCKEESEGCNENRSTIKFDSLTEKGKEFVNDGGLTKYPPNERTRMADRLSQVGPGNTKPS